MDKIINYLFTSFPVLKQLDGYKRKIGNALLLLAGVLQLVQHYYPELPHVAQFIAYVGAATRLLGDVHAQSKESAS